RSGQPECLGEHRDQFHRGHWPFEFRRRAADQSPRTILSSPGALIDGGGLGRACWRADLPPPPPGLFVSTHAGAAAQPHWERSAQSKAREVGSIFVRTSFGERGGDWPYQFEGGGRLGSIPRGGAPSGHQEVCWRFATRRPPKSMARTIACGAQEEGRSGRG